MGIRATWTGGTHSPWCHPHVGGGTEQLKQSRGAELGSGVIPTPHRPLPNLSTAWSKHPGHATSGMNIGLDHPRGHPDGTCHLHCPGVGSGQGCGWAPRTPPPRAGHPAAPFHRGAVWVSPLRVGVLGVGDISPRLAGCTLLPLELGRSLGEHPAGWKGISRSTG